MNKEYTSKSTSIKDSTPECIEIGKRFNLWSNVGNNLDMGGGITTKLDNYLQSIGWINHKIDPYNVTQDVNDNTRELFTKYPADTTTLNNVLNVIKHKEDRLNILQEINILLKNNALMIVHVNYNTNKPMGETSKDSWQNNARINQTMVNEGIHTTYLTEIETFFNVIHYTPKFAICENRK